MKNLAYFCAYAPLPLLSSCGFRPLRVLPTENAPEAAGQWLHDNMCPHVKRLLDRAVAGELPKLDAVLVVNSCDPMRRLADAWR
ncbi:MAG: 2-hydroxyacyl-CoA dehydratase, partial [Deltaproteobacteria bacterium]